jgi:hypothetical protein
MRARDTGGTLPPKKFLPNFLWWRPKSSRNNREKYPHFPHEMWAPPKPPLLLHELTAVGINTVSTSVDDSCVHGLLMWGTGHATQSHRIADAYDTRKVVGAPLRLGARDVKEKVCARSS